jgi:CRISPR/Cas system-associated endoribonuclease Cas2
MKTTILSTLAITALLALNLNADAQSWGAKHPRRKEVNKRLANQNNRIHKEVKEGELTKGQAGKLHKEDRQIRQEERDMASQNHGHITKQEQKTLNQQENHVSKQIGN